LNDEPEYISNIHDENNVYDIGPKSFEILVRKIKESDIIFLSSILNLGFNYNN
jgi:3-phosphoglycerate kinase